MIPDRVERRLAAILAADVAGYSRLMEVDEEGTLAVLKELLRGSITPVIASHGGRILKTTGDGLLAEFPSPVGAVRSAIEIQHKLAEFNVALPSDRRIELRIGINLGDVISDDDDLYGDAVNVASRLEGLAEPGSICVSRAIRDQVRGKIPASFHDIGEHQVKNITRPVRVFTILPGHAAPPANRRSRRRIPVVVAAVGSLLVLAGAGGWALISDQQRPSSVSPAETRAAPAERLSMSVLPFTSIGDDRDQDWFADGITEDLTTELSRYGNMRVISRSSALVYKGRQVDARQVASELGVRYLLEGSVRRVGDDMRVNVQLIDAISGGHLWADRFDGKRSELARFNDEIVKRIAHALRLEITIVEGARNASLTPHEVDADDLALRGFSRYVRGRSTIVELQEVLPLFEEAARRDPNNLRALEGIGLVYSLLRWRGAVDPKIAEAKTAETAQRMREIAPAHYNTMMAQGRARTMIGDWDSALPIYEAVVARFPSAASAYGERAMGLLMTGRPDDEVFANLDEAARLSPLDPRLGTWHYMRAFAYYYRGNYREAASWSQRSAAYNPDFALNAYLLPAALLRAGDGQKAAEAFKDFRQRFPQVTATRLLARPATHPKTAAVWNELVETLRELGLPE